MDGLLVCTRNIRSYDVLVGAVLGEGALQQRLSYLPVSLARELYDDLLVVIQISHEFTS